MPSSSTSSILSQPQPDFADPGQRVAEDDQRRAGQDVPGVEKCQPAQHQGNAEESCFADLELAEEQIDFAVPAAEEDIQATAIASRLNGMASTCGCRSPSK